MAWLENFLPTREIKLAVAQNFFTDFENKAGDCPEVFWLIFVQQPSAGHFFLVFFSSCEFPQKTLLHEQGFAGRAIKTLNQILMFFHIFWMGVLIVLSRVGDKSNSAAPPWSTIFDVGTMKK